MDQYRAADTDFDYALEERWVHEEGYLKIVPRVMEEAVAAAGVTEALYPGESEWNKEQVRRKEGIFVEDETWAQLSDLMKSLNVEAEVGQA